MGCRGDLLSVISGCDEDPEEYRLFPVSWQIEPVDQVGVLWRWILRPQGNQVQLFGSLGWDLDPLIGEIQPVSTRSLSAVVKPTENYCSLFVNVEFDHRFPFSFLRLTCLQA
jgi:hypothetical protein